MVFAINPSFTEKMCMLKGTEPNVCYFRLTGLGEYLEITKLDLIVIGQAFV